MNNIEKLRHRIKGPVFSIITPFLPKNDEIDYEALKKYINYIHQGGARIFYVMGYNSRFSELSWDEIKQLNQFVTDNVKELDSNNIVIVADPLHCSTKVSIEFAQHAQSIGADIISIICREKYYFDDQIYNHYNSIADKIDIGILVHEMPFLNGLGGSPINYPLSLLDRLADIPNIIAVKEDAKDDDYSRQVIDTIKDRVAIVISGGGKRQWLRFAEKGCQAWLNGIGVFEPRFATNFWRCYQQGRKDKCQEIIDKIEIPFFEHGVQRFGWHLTIKATLEHLGLMSRYERLPLQALPEKEYLQVAELIDSLPIQEVIENTN
ncbi:dihydrodipicolinate synthase family protein [Cyanobacterium sp. Dongsha4]|uniref:dihydrodipicolinate synthase family protein n=1 Tax=Cyanobacterium sp. DS4 TaxID=2878255 RepID=UPI002E81B608|nr:dihydrodipicolinate synthase family protein [Cyanobacterium sp. Dongsha4]WVL02250.1 dihydrodipicolinate synthase family protein [Cyanobacterium sp. Dongsha4]